MLPLKDIDDLIKAIHGLAPNPFMELLVPTVVGLVGVFAGFGLSTWKEAAGRKRVKAEARRAALAESRRPAVNGLIRYIESAISNFQRPDMSQKLVPSIDLVAALFANSDEPGDLTIGRDVRKFLGALSSLLIGTGRTSAESEGFEWTEAQDARLHELSTQIAEYGRLWVDDSLSTPAFSGKLALRTVWLTADAPIASL